MPNTTTPASVASRLTDEDIINIAKSIDDCGAVWKFDVPNIAAVLRDYVRMRRLK